MYIFSFNRFAWFDRVFELKISDNLDLKLKKILKIWNLVKYEDDIFLCLWNEISFKEQYEYKYDIKKPDFEIVCKSFLGEKTIDMINWMVYYRYSNYKSVLRYFISFDIEKLIWNWKQKPENKNNKIKNNEILIENWSIEISNKEIVGQQLIVFPDLRTLFNTVDEKLLSIKWNVLLNSNDTQNQKDKKWWMIKNNLINNVFCTHWEIFQDWNKLSKIILLDPYKWYYENQQDPRYNVQDVLKKMSNIYSSELVLK